MQLACGVFGRCKKTNQSLFLFLVKFQTVMANNSMNGSQVPGFSVPAPHVYIVATLYTLISFAAIIGNGLVLASFFKSSKIRNSRTNYLVVSLSCADIVAGSVAVPLYMYFMLNDFKEYNGSTGYFTYQFTDVFSITASVWHLAVISLERLVCRS